MKNTLVLLLICLLSGFTGFSQTQKGARYLGANLRFGADKVKNDNGSQTQVNILTARVDAGKFIYDDFAIYIAAKMYDNPDSILRESGQRDSFDKNTDMFGIGFDTYNKKQNAFFFMVSPAGMQNDMFITPSNEDENWNAVWKQVAPTRFASTLRNWGIPFAATSNTAALLAILPSKTPARLHDYACMRPNCGLSTRSQTKYSTSQPPGRSTCSDLSIAC